MLSIGLLQLLLSQLLTKERLANSDGCWVLALIHLHELFDAAQVKALYNFRIDHSKLIHLHTGHLRSTVSLGLHFTQIFQLILLAVEIEQLLLIIRVLGLERLEHSCVMRLSAWGLRSLFLTDSETRRPLNLSLKGVCRTRSGILFKHLLA